jgi:hypothetical protein
MCTLLCNRLPSSGEVYIFQRGLGQRRGRGGKETNFIAKFGRYVCLYYTVGDSEDPD